MTIPIKYIVKSKPRTTKKVATWIIATGALFLLIGNFLYAPLSTLPMELRASAIVKLLPEIIFDFDFLTLLIIATGFGLLLFKWRTGEISLYDDCLNVNGSFGISILMKNIIDIDFFDSEFGVKRTIQINSTTDSIKLKFHNDNDFQDFSTKLVETANKFEKVNMKTWTS